MEATPGMTRRGLLWLAAAAPARTAPQPLKGRIAAALRKQLDLIAPPSGEPGRVKGKDAAALLAMSFELVHGLEKRPHYRAAALTLAGRVLREMQAMPAGVLMIKEKRGGAMGGGPPALGWYAGFLGYIFHRAGGRAADLQYLAGVLDRFPWNPEGWWSATVDSSGRSIMPLDKPTPVNKNAGMAMACAMLSEFVRPFDAAISSRLRDKTVRCLERQIFPAQVADGSWHYGLTGRDPNNKDATGYFMLTAGLLIRLSLFAPTFRSPALDRALARAAEYAARTVPGRYDCGDDFKRFSALALLLWHGGRTAEAAKALECTLGHYPYEDRGQEGGKAAIDAATILLL
jgi:hypothetical protein